MSLTKQILLAFISGSRFSYRQLSENGTRPTKNSRGFNFTEFKKQTLKTTLSRLKSRGLLENKNKMWKITQKGRDYIKNDTAFKKICHLKQSSREPKNMIIIFDIPELHREKRDWLRIELISLGFSMLQKSVWLGPSPLPKEFVDYADEINVLPYMKFFKAKESDIL